MMGRFAILLALAAILPAVLPGAAGAESLIALRTVRPQTVVEPGDVTLVEAEIPGALTDPAAAIGLEARVALYAGRPIRPGDVGPPAIVERNQIVPLSYAAGGLSIVTEGRALDRAGPGDTVRILNLASRSIVQAVISESGMAEVGARP